MRQRIPALDGLRGLATLMVIVFHFGRATTKDVGSQAIGFFAQFGWAGVDLFFVLSGFLIGGILLDSRGQKHAARRFFRRRALRIFPLYFAFLAVYIFILVPLLPGPPSDVFQRQKWLWTYLANFDIAANGWYASAGSHANNFWSLAIEEQFYLFAPLAVLCLPRRHVASLAGLCALGAIAARFVLDHAGFPGRAGYFLTFTRVDGLALGVLLAIAARHGNVFERLAAASRFVAPACVALIIAVSWRWGFHNEDWRTLEFVHPAVTVCAASLLVLAVSPAGGLFVHRPLESSGLRFFGRYSYGLYVWHPLVGHLMSLAGIRPSVISSAIKSPSAALALAGALKIGVSVLVAIASYKLIERPFLLIKDRQREATGELATVPSEYSAKT